MASEQSSSPQRVITTHNSKSGQSVFDTSISTTVPTHELPGGSTETYYASEGFPHSLAEDSDLKTYQGYLETPPGIVIPNGTVCRSLNMNPKASFPMHRTISIDVGVVVDGSVRLELDSGESRVLKKGDVFVQRETMHAWHNDSETEVARMFIFTQPAAPVEVAGKALTEDLSKMGQ